MKINYFCFFYLFKNALFVNSILLYNIRYIIIIIIIIFVYNFCIKTVFTSRFNSYTFLKYQIQIKCN